MAGKEKIKKKEGLTRSAADVQAVVKPLIDAAVQAHQDINTIETMFSETHSICKIVGIPEERVLKRILNAMIKDKPSFEKSTTLEKRDCAPEMQDFLAEGKVVGGRITTIGSTPTEGSWKIWFERKDDDSWILAYSKIAVQGNLRTRSVITARVN